jgi:transcriptional regulator with XRE-family HTH domain
MTGLDLEELGRQNPVIACATAVVKVVNAVAKLLREFRAKSGLSQAEMAAKLDVSQPRIAQLESGKPGNVPSLEQVAEYAFHTGHDLLICDRAKVADLPEYQALQTKIQSLERRNRELLEKRARELNYVRAPMPVIGFRPMPEMGKAANWQQGQQPAQVPCGWVIPIPVGKSEYANKGAALGNAPSKTYTMKTYTIGMGDRDETFHFYFAGGDEMVVNAGEVVEQWTCSVPKDVLKDLAHSLEASANEPQATSAYDVLTRVSEKLGTVVQVETPATTEKPGL